jgi:hypothetical protein
MTQTKQKKAATVEELVEKIEAKRVEIAVAREEAEAELQQIRRERNNLEGCRRRAIRERFGAERAAKSLASRQATNPGFVHGLDWR